MLSSTPGELTPHSARSSHRARQLQLIRAELPSNGSCLALESSYLPSCFILFFFFLRLATPALRLGVIGSWRPSELYLLVCATLRTQVRPAIEFVSGKKSLRPRIAVFVSSCCSLRVQVFFEFGNWDTLKFASAPGLSGGRGEMAMAVASSARLAFIRGAVCACCTPYTRRFHSWSSQPQPLGSGGDVASCENTKKDFGLSVSFPSTTYCCRVGFLFVSPRPSGLMRASGQFVARHAHSLRCENATWVTAQQAVREGMTWTRHSEQCWLWCPELPGPSGLMRASERSRRRQLM